MSSYERIGPDSEDEDERANIQRRRGPNRNICEEVADKTEELMTRARDFLCSKEFLRVLVLGQMVSFLLCGTGVFTGLLQDQGVHTPTAQTFLNYVLLCLIFGVMLACRQQAQGRHLGEILQQDGWKYAILGLIDVEANYLTVKAYSYTTITSAQVLDCCSIVVVVVLSRFFLKAHYGWTHLLGMAISMVGLATLITADVISGRNQNNSANNKPLGDLLVIIGASLYGVSNVAQEFVVKNYPRSDFLGMIGIFGSIISGLQFIALERHEVSELNMTSFEIWGPWVGYVICLFLIYTTMSYAIQQTSATTVNISILSADFYTLLFGLFLFDYKFNMLYIVAFVGVMVGLVIFSAKPIEAHSLRDDEDEPEQQAPQPLPEYLAPLVPEYVLPHVVSEPRMPQQQMPQQQRPQMPQQQKPEPQRQLYR